MRQKPVIFSLALVILLLLTLSGGYWNIRVAQNALEEQDYHSAYSSYTRAAQILFWRGDLYEQAGIAAFQAGEYDNAIKSLHQINHLSETGCAMLAASYYHAGKVEESIRTYQNGIAQFPGSVKLHEGLAYIYRAQKQWQQEFETLKQQALVDEKNPYLFYRAGLLSAIFNVEESLSYLTAASTLNPELDPAVQTIRAALAESAVLADASQQKVVIGRAFGLVNEWDLAEYTFQQAVEINAENAEAWAWLGEAKQQNGKDGGVELDQALMLDPSSASIHALHGLYWSRQEEYGKMLTSYLLAAQHQPENPAWRASAADAYYKLGNLNQALTQYQRAIELSPNEATYYRLLALFCADTGVQVEELGLPAALKAVEISPEDPAALDALGLSYFATGRFANAEQTFITALQINAEYFPVRLHLALNYLAQGSRAAAFNELTYVRDADVSGMYAETARQLLEQYFP